MSAANYLTNNENSAVAAKHVQHNDLIDSKFNELAKKILDEFKQTDCSRNFFQALDMILNETPDTGDLSHSRHKQQRGFKHGSKTTRRQENQLKDISSETNNNNLDNLKKQCELLIEKQRQQQEQLDSHQQILFDSQYRSLPAEITQAVAGHEQRRANAKSQAASSTVHAGDSVQVTVNGRQPETATNRKQTTGQHKANGGVKTCASKENLTSGPKRDSPTAKPDQRQQRSAIPQSTILSGISQKAEVAANYPIGKSATVGAVANAEALNSGLKRQASLKLNRQSREAQQEFIKQQTRPLAASEKLKQRRPTKAVLGELRPAPSDDSDLDDDNDDEDDDDDEFEYQNLASRRAYLNQRFINQQQESQPKKGNDQVAVQQHPATAGRPRQQVTSTIQAGIKQAPVNTANMTVAKQKQRFSSGAQVVRSSTIGASQMPTRPSGGAARQQARSAREDQAADQAEQEPRSLGGLLTSHDISQLYKPHMNYSTSLLGNHRLSDDDEIIIIPTCQSPSLMSASVSPVAGGQQQQQSESQHPDRTTNNIDEFSERFSISRTKSFWEKLANSKSSGGGGGELEPGKCNGPSQQQIDKQYFNSSQRSLSSGPNLVDSKSPNCSLLNQSIGSHNTSGQSPSAGQHHYPAAMKSAFDRMDSTGGSGNSHYSGCSSSSSTSGDEQTHSSGAGPLNLAERRAMLVSAVSGNAKPDTSRHQSRRSPANASINPTISQLVQQDLINRSDKFRQTR